MNENKHNLLKEFFGGYFHEDFLLDVRNTSEVIADYVKVTTDLERTILSNAIQSYIKMFPDDGELERRLFFDLGCYYRPSADGFTAKDWLKKIAADLLRSS